jgi:hypothetical protein
MEWWSWSAVWALGLALLYAGGIDIMVAWGDFGAKTVSENVRELAAKYPIIPYLIGLLCGHLFWR